MFGLGTARRLVVTAAVAAVVGAGVLFAPAVAAAAPPSLAGLWAPLNRCPVDDPGMLAADGATRTAICVASAAASGEMKLGNTVATTGGTDLQIGLLSGGGQFLPVGPSDGAIVGDPVQIPGGLLGLMCPSGIPVLSDICEDLANGAPNGVTATVESAGAPTDFDVSAGLRVGAPILTLPVKIHLHNPILGSNCYLGSDSDPIILRPANLTAPSASTVRFDVDGTANPSGEMGYIAISGANQGDSSFAVPAAKGCGLLGLFGLIDAAVNLKVGLPSAAGDNSLTLNDPSTYLGGFHNPAAFTPDEGRQLSDRWHAAVVD